MSFKTVVGSFLVVCAAALSAQAGTVQITGGTTFIQLDENALRPLGLTVTEVAGADLLTKPGFFGFPINLRTDTPPTTFEYDSVALVPFSGSFEHTGSITISDGDLTTVGDFQISAADDRPEGTSGFFAKSTMPELILFDVAELTGEPDAGMVDFGETYFNVDAPLLIAPELASFLGNESLAGVVVGSVKKRAIAQPVPAPASSTLLLVGTSVLGLLRRRNRR